MEAGDVMLKSLVVSIFAAGLIVASQPCAAQDMPADYQGVMTALGKSGDFKDGVLKINIPRSDLKVTIEVAHHHVVAALALRERDPSAESQRRRNRPLP